MEQQVWSLQRARPSTLRPRVAADHQPCDLVSQIRLRRDSWVSVMYAEELNAGQSSVTLQRTDRHEIVGQKRSHFRHLSNSS